MKVLLTGATGFLGSHLARGLLRSKHEVAALKRSSSDTHRITDLLPELKTFNLDALSLEQIFAGQKFDAVIHVATCYGRAGESISTVFDANVRFPLLVMEQASSYNVGFFYNTDTFFSRAGSTYSHLDNYILTKKQFLEWGKKFAKVEKIHFVNFALEHVYGTDDQDDKFIPFLVNSCLAGAKRIPLTDGRQRRDFVYVEDVVAAYLAVLERQSEVEEMFLEYEVGSGQSVSVRSVAEMVRQITGAQTVLDFGVLPQRECEIMNSQADLHKLQSFDWQPQIKLEQGLSLLVNQMRTLLDEDKL